MIRKNGEIQASQFIDMPEEIVSGRGLFTDTLAESLNNTQEHPLSLQTTDRLAPTQEKLESPIG